MLTSRRRLLLVVEGKETERRYFEGLRAELSSRRVDVSVVSVGGGSMVNKLRRATDEAKCKLYDSVWCVLDADKYGDAPEVTAKLIKSAQKHGVKLAISNPCFEVWYLCHASNGYSSSSLTSAEAKKKAAQLLSHDWNAPARHFKALRDFLPRAVENARLVRSAHFEFDPVQSNRCTSVDELLIDVGLATLDNERG